MVGRRVVGRGALSRLFVGGACLGFATAASAQNGPEITYLAVANADGSPTAPESVDADGRDVFERILGSGFLLVVEGGPGESGERVGRRSFVEAEPEELPDLQVLVSRPLGNGDPAVCAVALPPGDGVPGFDPPLFGDSADVVDAVNDLGCRFADANGGNFGRTDPQAACTTGGTGFGFDFVGEASTIQFCASVTRDLLFVSGETIVAARLRDVTGHVGPVREMVVRITGPTATPTPTVTPTATPLPPVCAGDCDENGTVTVGELVRSVEIGLRDASTAECPSADPDFDGRVSIDELTAAVRNGIEGCADDGEE